MWADATRAEAYRLAHSRSTWFWSVLFLPIVTVIFGAIGAFVVKANADRLTEATQAPPELTALLTGAPLNLGEALVANAAELAGPALLLFVLIGAATVFAGDYRWETWRLVSARNSRPNLLTGKLLVVLGLSMTAMIAMALAGVMETVIRAFVFERALSFSMSGEQVLGLALLWGLALLRVAQFLMLGLLAAVVTRSMMATLFIPLVVGVAQFFAPNVLLMMGVAPDSWLTLLCSPGAAIDVLHAAVNPSVVAATGQAEMFAKAWVSVLGWTLLPLAGALVWFQRQDLSKE